MTINQLNNTPGVKDRFAFGKYKGKSILQVINENPSYVIWCIENIKGFKIDETLKKELLSQYKSFTLNRRDPHRQEVLRLMERPYYMHASEAIDFLEYDIPEHF